MVCESPMPVNVVYLINDRAKNTSAGEKYRTFSSSVPKSSHREVHAGLWAVRRSELHPESVCMSYEQVSKKLNDDKYAAWKSNLNTILVVDDLRFVLTEECPQTPASNANRASRKAYDRWIKANEKARVYILASMSDVLARKHESLATAKEIMDSLKGMFGQPEWSLRHETIKYIYTKHMEGTSVREHVLDIMMHFNITEVNGGAIDEANQNLTKSKGKVVEANVATTKGKFKRGSSAKSKAAPSKSNRNIDKKEKGKTPKQTKGKKITEKGKCYHCGENGHWLRNCPKYLAQKKAEKELQDRGGEYMDLRFQEYLIEHGIKSQLSAPNTPQQNGVSERRNRTLLDMVRSMMSFAQFSNSFWGYALETDIYILNSVSETPYELWKEHKPNSSTKVVDITRNIGQTHPSQELGEPRRSGRVVRQPDRFLGLSEAQIIIHDDGIEDPLTYKQEMNDVDYDQWIKVMDLEMESMYSNSIWTLVDQPNDVRPIGRKWIYKRKRDQAAFLNGNLEESIYMIQPEGFIQKGQEQKAYEPCVYKRIINTTVVFLVLYGIHLSKEQCPKTPQEVEDMSNIPYAFAVGSLMYAMLCTRPDICYSVGIVSRYQSNPGHDHWTAVKNILKYLRRTKCYMLMYGSKDLIITGYTDSDFQTDKDHRKSTSGSVFTLNGGAVVWRSIKQSCIVDSTMEAEYIASCEAAKEAVWLKKFLIDLEVVPNMHLPITLYCDNSGAVANSRELRSHK
ncbi:gag/pol protein [Cucumis melo var. makuwa]|uniref:Gag/pol protein n=1 Tax=Cucumis melo var. makuwa TaxID=1194695 RepID=A0A5D3DEL0_CUCMM|nr:gag/pol protein [Cucumis melo var. makuwa]TYK21973.1 gag/pol protein [Cucumis melo var. makuwa]